MADREGGNASVSVESFQKLLHFIDNLSFIRAVDVMVRVGDTHHAGARDAAAKGIGPGLTACYVVRDQSGFTGWVVGRKAVPVVRTGVDSECGDRNARVLLCAEVERGRY